MTETPIRDLSQTVLIAGAGPAGAAAATMLVRAGVDVLLVDKSSFPRPKICGDGITPGAMAALDELGFDRKRLGEGNPRIEKLVLVSPGGLRWEPDLGDAAVVERSRFDAAVLDHAIACGARFEPGWTVQVQGEVVSLRRGAETVDVRPRFLLAGDGEFSAIRRALTGELRPSEWLALRGYVDGVARPPTGFEFHMTHALRPGYGWVFPSGETPGHANVGVYVPRAAGGGVALRKLYDDFVEPLRCTRGAPPQGSPITPWSPSRTVRFGKTLLLGDAAGCADALSGEGIGPAMRSGICAAAAVRAALEKRNDDALDGYAHALAAAFLPARRRSAVILGALQRAPGFVDRAFELAPRDPTLADAIARVVKEGAHPMNLLHPGIVARFLLPGWFR